MHYCQYVRFSVLEPRAERDDGEIERSIAGWIPSQKRQQTGPRIAPARLHPSVLYTLFFSFYISLYREMLHGSSSPVIFTHIGSLSPLSQIFRKQLIKPRFPNLTNDH
jgi:hypothetical protein